MSHHQYLEPLSDRVMRWALAAVAVGGAVLVCTASVAVVYVVIFHVIFK